MKVISAPERFRDACEAVRGEREKVGLVPTMGALHAGHLSLIDAARAAGTKPAVTIFVNPTQFAPNEDLALYPRTLEADLERCEAHGAALVFVPDAADMYAQQEATRVSVRGLTEPLCGASRPEHFAGVTTIVAKLLALAGRCELFLGRKDYQQYRVLLRMVTDLLLPVRVSAVRTVREPDGLAMSSRNVRLLPRQRPQALALVRALSAAARGFAAGERDATALLDAASRPLLESGVRQDYLALCDADSLELLRDQLPERALLAVAAYVGDVRLIDNIELGHEMDPLASGAHEGNS